MMLWHSVKWAFFRKIWLSKECWKERMSVISCMKIFLFRVGTKLQETGFVFEDLTFQRGVPEEPCRPASFFSPAQAKVLSVLVVVWAREWSHHHWSRCFQMCLYQLIMPSCYCTFTEPANRSVSWKGQSFLAREPEETRGSMSFLASIQQCFCPGLSHLSRCRDILQNLLTAELLRVPLLHAGKLMTVPRKQKLFQEKIQHSRMNEIRILMWIKHVGIQLAHLAKWLFKSLTKLLVIFKVILLCCPWTLWKHFGLNTHF